ncbi:MAG: carboxymethylenebutenolidase [Alphaproteobacteria bacterium CG_4_9_14_3_um_filter_47_13]|nr:MAG: carboxymethylenebutenolidase [Alphaproteobacteria bacterium CG_4_9_14_3_um_filter_47_13]
MGKEILISIGKGKNFMAYAAFPEQTPAPAVIVAQEIFGVNQGLRDKCDWLAEEGFIAVCPDLFWRIEPGIQLTDQSKAEWARAFELFNLFDVNKGIEDLIATAAFMNEHPQSNGKTGCIGYCLGGKLAYLMATRSQIDVSVGYYGVGLEMLLNESTNITKPLMLHIPEEDQFVPKEAQAKIKETLQDHPQVTIHSYPGLDHAFTRLGGAHYDEAGAKLADQRTIDFLKNHTGL